VTEAVAGVDLVELQLAVAAGGKLPLTQQDVSGGGETCRGRDGITNIPGRACLACQLMTLTLT
jgi:biotin carboxylase